MKRIGSGLALAALLAACGEPTSHHVPARIDAASVVANPNMVVSVLVKLSGSGDSARIVISAPSTTLGTTPSFAGPFSNDTLPVLGLVANTDYTLRVVMYGGTPAAPESVFSAPLTITTGALPADLPAYTAGGADPQPGYVVFSSSPYGLVIDNSGRVVWYKRFPAGGPGLNFMAQPTGTFVGRFPTADATDDDPMIEIDPVGREGRHFDCKNGRPLRFHDMLLATDGSYWMMCDDTRTMDLTAHGGVSNARVTATVLQHIGATGTVLFEWNAFDHFLITDLDPSALPGAVNVNFTHGNSFDIDTDGNVLLSFRSLDEVTKINAQTGAVIWRMGGRRNQFAFSGAPDSGFARQHNLRVIGPNRFIVLDNVGRGIGETRYERYLVNPGALTAVLEQSYGSVPATATTIGGSVAQVGPNRYLVSVGTQGRVEEFDASGSLLWKINGNPGYVFRAQRIASLYHPVPVVTR